MQGNFVVFEGGEGGGKSTQAKKLAGMLRQRGIPVVETREPGGTQVADAIRSLVVTGREDKMLPLTEAFLMYAARHEHVEKIIKPALLRGEWVVCDRFYDSTNAYQGAGGLVSSAALRTMEDWVVLGCRPSLVIVLDLPPEIGLDRSLASKSGEASLETRFESKDIEFHRAVRDYFLRRADSDTRYTVVDATLSVGAVEYIIKEKVEAFFGLPVAENITE